MGLSKESPIFCYPKIMPGLRQQVRGLIPLIIIGLALPIILIALPQAVKYLGKASGVPANIVVDTQAILGPLPRPWRNLAQGGEELSSPMIDDVTGEIKQLRTEYVRLDHLYDGYNIVGRGSDGRLTYDWSKLDSVVSDILKAGAKPFMALSYMPAVISKGDIVDLPKDYGEWEQVVKATIEHYSGRNGMNIANVYYEVWNEPDLFGKWKTYTDKNYLTLYLYAAKGAARANNVNGFKLGGPATTALYKNWVDSFLNFAVENKLKLDFYSWHRYNTELDQYEDDWKQINNWLDAHPEKAGLELIVSEWGHNSENDKGYDGSFGAIHTLAVSRVMMGRINRGFVFEIKDGPGNEQYWGRWGLLTHEKWGSPVKKPRFRALELLNSLGENRISVTGEGSWVKAIGTENEGKIKTLLVNYDQKGRHEEAVPVRFENLPSGDFTYKRTDFLGGSKTTKVATTSSEWATVEYMKANTAAVLEISF